ncbi:Oidioi.mRNA.OKI2018_I69.chr1.g198.t1.cds [Oikopleura dioica]|uniref:Oidioi.mRNA.OKI2018_I69.chr1.g198.t1.cds n=1 Tax=Oikopleura dioica TaxID=34765 RepID=A0ABN7SP72_OIKDI|nr:Oidioi.mRNA.OKI2018_I69.chr1.g198.t1.cds [Oikopleura dioica]
MKISSALFVLLENASGQTVGRTHYGTAYGDMVFSGCQYERMKNDPRLQAGVHFNYDGSSCSSPIPRHFPTWRGYQDDSDGKFIVPFFFDSEYKNADEINDLLNVKFVEIFQDEVDLYPDHIEIVSEENDDFLSACASYIGKIGGKQKWFMRPDCAFHDDSQVNHFAVYILGFGPTFTRNSRHGQGNGYHSLFN